jgi:hypothetical protein
VEIKVALKVEYLWFFSPAGVSHISPAWIKDVPTKRPFPSENRCYKTLTRLFNFVNFNLYSMQTRLLPGSTTSNAPAYATNCVPNAT